MASSHASNADNDTSNTTDASNEAPLKRGSGDIGWDYGMLIDPKKPDKWKCKLCGQSYSGGVYRIKLHIGHVKGNIVGCPKAKDEDRVKCKVAIEASKKKKEKKSAHAENIREEVEIEQEEIEIIEGLGPRKKPRSLGPMDKYVFANNVDDTSKDAMKTMEQQSIRDALWKERSLSVHQYMARWIYESGIPFHAIDNDSFKRFVEAVGQFGPSYQPPSQYQLREPLLTKEVERTRTTLKKQVEEWERNGCSIMTDAWSDRERSIMNLCVNCMEGTTFLSSKEASNYAHTGQYIFEYVNKCIDKVGAQNVVQVVTDNASNNMVAAKLLKEKRPNIFWTPCATHTLNLMLEGIGKLPSFKGVINKARAFTVFIYSHHETLALMRKHTEREIVRPRVTRFATSFLTLQSLIEMKQDLREMVLSDAWGETKWSKSKKGKAAYSTVVQTNFWNGVALCLKVFTPLLKVFKLVDGEKKPSMGFVYGEMLRAKEEIKEAFKMREDKYKSILDIIESKGKGHIDTSIHLAAYALNPFYFFKKSTIIKDNDIMEAIFTCVEKFFPEDETNQDLVMNVEWLKYTTKKGEFGRSLAASGCEKNDDNYNPVGWWSNYGTQTPNLQRMAKRILALTTSSSGCERNWSVFEGIHTKKRNKLDTERINNLVYVQFNARLMNKKNKRHAKLDSLLSSEATTAQSWVVDDIDEEEEIVPGSGVTWGFLGETSGANEELEPRKSQRNVIEEENVRELDEEDFLSDGTEDGDEEEEFEFESDKEFEANIHREGDGDDLPF